MLRRQSAPGLLSSSHPNHPDAQEAQEASPRSPSRFLQLRIQIPELQGYAGSLTTSTRESELLFSPLTHSNASAPNFRAPQHSVFLTPVMPPSACNTYDNVNKLLLTLGITLDDEIRKITGSMDATSYFELMLRLLPEDEREKAATRLEEFNSMPVVYRQDALSAGDREWEEWLQALNAKKLSAILKLLYVPPYEETLTSYCFPDRYIKAIKRLSDIIIPADWLDRDDHENLKPLWAMIYLSYQVAQGLVIPFRETLIQTLNEMVETTDKPQGYSLEMLVAAVNEGAEGKDILTHVNSENTRRIRQAICDLLTCLMNLKEQGIALPEEFLCIMQTTLTGLADFFVSLLEEPSEEDASTASSSAELLTNSKETFLKLVARACVKSHEARAENEAAHRFNF